MVNSKRSTAHPLIIINLQKHKIVIKMTTHRRNCSQSNSLPQSVSSEQGESTTLSKQPTWTLLCSLQCVDSHLHPQDGRHSSTLVPFPPLPSPEMYSKLRLQSQLPYQGMYQKS